MGRFAVAVALLGGAAATVHFTSDAMKLWINITAFLSCLGASVICARAEGLAGQRPNVILILTDDQGYGDASCNGNPILKTPNIDRLYSEAVHFEDFHVSPTCSPTRAALLSGRHEFQSGVTHTILERERMSLKTTTIAQTLQAAGYATGIFGKWHLGDEDAYQPGKRGFAEVFIHGGGGIGQTYPGSCGDVPGNRYSDPVIKHNGTFEETHGFCTDVFFDQAQKWISTLKKEQPFFLYLPTNAAHEPVSCPPEYEKPYAGKVPPKVATFFGMIANIDENVGKLMVKLKELGIDKNTLVVFMNDNGGYAPAVQIYNAGMRGSKCMADNGGTRAMSLWRWPGTLKPGACNKLTAHLDVFPTLVELAGAAAGAKGDGFSLVPLLENPQAPWHEERMLFTHVGRWGGMKTGVPPVKFGQSSVRWKQYLQVYENSGWHLYDLNSDPGEKIDLAAGNPELLAKLGEAYNSWWDQVLPSLENEQAWKNAPAVNPFKTQYWKQFNGPGPNNVPKVH